MSDEAASGAAASSDAGSGGAVSGSSAPGSAVIGVGDPARALAWRGVLCSLAVAAAFIVFAVLTTQDKPLRDHSPWQDDPYDVVVSFTQFLVPAIVFGVLVRVQLCRRELPLPSVRLRDLLRAARLSLAAVALTLATDWVAVALGAHRRAWGRDGLVLIVALALLSLGVLVAALAMTSVVRKTRASRWSRSPVLPTDPDWFDDSVAVLSLWLRHFGRTGDVLSRGVRRGAAVVLDGRCGLRRHPVLAAAVVCVGFAATVVANDLVHEGGHLKAGVVLLLASIGASGLFAISVAAGSYLRVLRPAPGGSVNAISRIATRVGWAAAASVPVTVAFRAQLGRAADLGSNTPGQLARLLIVGAAIAATAAMITLLAGRARRSTVRPQ